MIHLRVLRSDRQDVVLAECDSPVLPMRGEIMQLDTLDSDGAPAGASTLWRVVSVTMHVPSVRSAARTDGEKLRVQQVEVYVQPDSGIADLLERRAQATMSESAI
jgi:hypothetical protein